MPKPVWVVIVNFRTPDLVVDCLRSLESQVSILSSGQVVVVDNHSGDDSVGKIDQAIRHNHWESWASVRPMAINGGFAYGNNAGIDIAMQQAVPPDYVLLLNPDTVVYPGALGSLVSFMESHLRAGIAGSAILSQQGVVQRSAHRFPTPVSEFLGGARSNLMLRLLNCYAVSPDVPIGAHACEWVSGASFMIRREALESVGKLDEGYFLYFEEVDFCRYAINAGWQVWYVPESRVMHIEGVATEIAKASVRRPGYWYDSRRRYFLKHFGVAGLLAADVLWAFGRMSYLLRQWMILNFHGDPADPKYFMLDLLWGDIKAVVARMVGASAANRNSKAH